MQMESSDVFSENRFVEFPKTGEKLRKVWSVNNSKETRKLVKGQVAILMDCGKFNFPL